MIDNLLAMAIEAIDSAPLSGDWEAAVASISMAVGGWCGELFQFGPDDIPTKVVSHGIDLDVERDFIQAGGVDPLINPRARILRREPMKVLGDDALAAEDEVRANPFFDFFKQIDVPNLSIARIAGERGGSTVMAVLRSASAGPAGPDELARFEALLPHLQQSLRIQRHLDGAAADLCRAVLEAVRMPAIMLDARGRVLGMTGLAEALVGLGRPLRLRYGMLECAHPASAGALGAAVAAALGPHPAAGRVLIEGPEPLVAEVAPLPAGTSAFASGARALVLFPALRPASGDRAAALRRAFHLSRSEAEVALQLAEAISPMAIAAGRGVSLGTVRQQIKMIHAKCGVRDRAALVRAVWSVAGPSPGT